MSWGRWSVSVMRDCGCGVQRVDVVCVGVVGAGGVHIGLGCRQLGVWCVWVMAVWWLGRGGVWGVSSCLWVAECQWVCRGVFCGVSVRRAQRVCNGRVWCGVIMCACYLVLLLVGWCVLLTGASKWGGCAVCKQCPPLMAPLASGRRARHPANGVVVQRCLPAGSVQGTHRGRLSHRHP